MKTRCLTLGLTVSALLSFVSGSVFAVDGAFDAAVESVQGMVDTTGLDGGRPVAITDEASASPSQSWTDSPGGEYDDYWDFSLTSPVLDSFAVAGVTLEFSHIYDLESGSTSAWGAVVQ